MIRVLNAIHYPIFGGPHNQALRLAAPLCERGWETIVALPDEPGNAADRLRKGGVEVVQVPLHRLRASVDLKLQARFLASLAPDVQSIRRIIRARSIGLVQVGGLVNPHAAVAARLENVPVVWQLLDTRAPWPVGVVATALVGQLADVVMSTGRSVANWYPGGGRFRDRVIQFFPPVDIDRFRPRPGERDAVRSALGIPLEAQVIGCVANINPQKGIVDLVRAFALVRQKVPAAVLVLLGAEYSTHQRYSAELREHIATSGLREGHDVRFLGERSDVERHLAAFDVFAFAPLPRAEGVSTVLLEAMAAGLPVVTTAVAGIPEAIADGETGRLVPPLDPRAMADAIFSLLLNPIQAADLGQAARRHAVTTFAVPRCVDAHERAYAYALTHRRKRRSAATGTTRTGN